MSKQKNLNFTNIEKNKWELVFKKSWNTLWTQFDHACEIMELGEDKKAEATFRAIIKTEPQFIDAYNELGVLLISKGSRAEGFSILEKGVEVILALLPDNFFDNKQQLDWEYSDNRAFLRCYANLAIFYLEEKRVEETKFILERMIMMNPNDDQGLRGPLLECYFQSKEIDQAVNLCERYPHDSLVSMNYGKALAFFMLGNEVSAKAEFKKAKIQSPLVAEEIIKSKHDQPEDFDKYNFLEFGGADEAYDYWLTFGKLWTETPGAMAFAKNCMGPISNKIKTKPANDKGETLH